MDVQHEIAARFCPDVIRLEPLGNGLINDTFLVQTPARPLVLQKINRQVFTHPELIMQNLTQLSQHLALNNSNNSLTIPELIKSPNGDRYLIDARGDYWRAWTYVENTDCLESFRTLNDAQQVGCALGKFHRSCHDIDTGNFHDTLPGFHIAPVYYEHYQQVKQISEAPPNTGCDDFIAQHRAIINDLEAAKAQHLLRVRVIHGDPKLNNFLFDKTTRQVVSLIDLDTVKPGLIHYDIGDCLRSCCHDETDNRFSTTTCRALLRGYFPEMADLLTAHDYEYIYPAIRLIPLELGLRFYTDYLDGNRYFKVTEPEQNLKRALTQFQLCASVIAQESEIKAIIKQERSSDN